MQKRDQFSKLKIGMKVNDLWYGSGQVVSKPNRGRVKIRLFQSGHMQGVKVYDREHVNAFIVAKKLTPSKR